MCLDIHLLQYPWNYFSRQLKDTFLNFSFNFPTQKIIPEIDKPKETSLYHPDSVLQIFKLNNHLLRLRFSA